MAERQPFCRYHCRPCGTHFTSLAAFDAHRPGPCDFPDNDEKGNPIEWREMQGVCTISDPSQRLTGTLYGLPLSEWMETLRREKVHG